MRRTIAQLVDQADPAWPLVKGWIAEAELAVEVLPASQDRDDALVDLQVTTRSPMGAITHESGGLRIDGGWLIVLGSGHPRAPWSIAALTRALGFWPDRDAMPELLVVGVDVMGGFFALDGGPLGNPGNVHYFAPDTLDWLDCEKGYSEWAHFCMSANVEQFYADLRWDGWEAEVARLPDGAGIHVHPPLFTAESKPLEDASRRAVPMLELLRMNLDFARQLGDAPD
ncbi:MAG TPA: DUF2625 family protein [Nannocystaceae bacterium]|nr:DUF2625 family protein [Nannocystaceae bacterium]